MNTYDQDKTDIFSEIPRKTNKDDYKRILRNSRFKLNKVQYLWSRARIYAKVIGRLLHLGKEIKTFGSSKKSFNNLTNIPTIPNHNSKCIFHPKSNFKLFWNWSIMFLLLYTATVTPYRLCFNVLQSPDWIIADLFIDIMFFVDIIITFNTATISISGKYNFSRIYIAKQYIKWWFWIDLVSCIPFDYNFSSETSTVTYNRFLRILKVTRMYKIVKIFRLFKLFRFFRSQYIESFIEKSKYQAGYRKSFTFIFALSLVVHLTGCIWYYVSTADGANSGSWIVKQKIQDKSDSEVYLICIYFVFTTLTTIGYGDITPSNDCEKVFVLVLISFGVGFYSYLISSFSNSVKSNDQASMLLKAKNKGIKEFCKAIRLPEHLMIRVKNHLKLNLTKGYTETVHIENLLNELPSNIKHCILNHVYNGIVEGIQFFRNKPNTFVNSIARCLQLSSYDFNNILYEENDSPEEVFFIKSGKVVLKVNSTIPFRVYFQGAYFGEIEIFFGTYRESSASICSKNAEIYSLSKREFLQVLEEYEDVYEGVKNIAEARKNKHAQSISEAIEEFNRRSSTLNNEEGVEEEESFNDENLGLLLKRNDTGVKMSLKNDSLFKQKNRKMWNNAIFGSSLNFNRKRRIKTGKPLRERFNSVDERKHRSLPTHISPISIVKPFEKKIVMANILPKMRSESLEGLEFDFTSERETKNNEENFPFSSSSCENIFFGCINQEVNIETKVRSNQMRDINRTIESVSKKNRDLSGMLIKLQQLSLISSV